MGILNEIIARKKLRIAEAKSRAPLRDLKGRIKDTGETRSFIEAIHRREGEPIKVIAEIKKASPSKGLIREDFDPLEIGSIYNKRGAAAISILTEEDFFQGDIEFIPKVKQVVSIPILRKDFIIDEYQLYEARVYQADAILLIAAILSKSQANEYLHMAEEIGISVLFEVHDWRECEMVLEVGAPIIGINNRDLDTLAIDMSTTLKLLKDIPDDRVVITESGISRRDDVERYESTRISAVLIGTALLIERDIGGKYDELFTG